MHTWSVVHPHGPCDTPHTTPSILSLSFSVCLFVWNRRMRSMPLSPSLLLILLLSLLPMSTLSTPLDKNAPYYTLEDLSPFSLNQPCAIPTAIQCDHSQSETGDLSLYFYCNPTTMTWQHESCGKWYVCSTKRTHRHRYCRFKLNPFNLLH